MGGMGWCRGVSDAPVRATIDPGPDTAPAGRARSSQASSAATGAPVSLVRTSRTGVPSSNKVICPALLAWSAGYDHLVPCQIQL